LDPVGHVESPLVDATRIKVKNLEALNGTPVLDPRARSER
jgi:tRNA (Thr-GGU) A37 N-methylase